MRRMLRTIAAAVMALLPRAAGAQVPWREAPLQTVIAEAQRDHRRVLVDFTASWCGPCQRMDATVWNRPDVAEALAAGWIPLRVSVESEAGGALQQRFRVTALPTLVALAPDGTESGRLSGMIDSAVLIRAIGAWGHSENLLGAFVAHLGEHPENSGLRLDVASRYAQAGALARATEQLERVVADDPQLARMTTAIALLTLATDIHLGRGDPAGAVPYLRLLVEHFALYDAGERSNVLLATALHRAGRDDEARAAIAAYFTHATDDVAAGRAVLVAAMMLRERWDLPAAEAYLRAWQRRVPPQAALTAMLADVVYAEGRITEAIELARAVAAMTPGDAAARQRVERFTDAPLPM